MHLFNNDLITETSGRIVFREKQTAAEAHFDSSGPCIKIKAHDNAPLIWALAQRRCADGAFFSFDDSGAHLHIVELKSKIYYENMGCCFRAI
jgi:hypothetical protein